MFFIIILRKTIYKNNFFIFSYIFLNLSKIFSMFNADVIIFNANNIYYNIIHIKIVC